MMDTTCNLCRWDPKNGIVPCDTHGRAAEFKALVADMRAWLERYANEGRPWPGAVKEARALIAKSQEVTHEGHQA